MKGGDQHDRSVEHDIGSDIIQFQGLPYLATLSFTALSELSARLKQIYMSGCINNTQVIDKNKIRLKETIDVLRKSLSIVSSNDLGASCQAERAELISSICLYSTVNRMPRGALVMDGIDSNVLHTSQARNLIHIEGYIRWEYHQKTKLVLTLTKVDSKKQYNYNVLGCCASKSYKNMKFNVDIEDILNNSEEGRWETANEGEKCAAPVIEEDDFWALRYLGGRGAVCDYFGRYAYHIRDLKLSVTSRLPDTVPACVKTFLEDDRDIYNRYLGNSMLGNSARVQETTYKINLITTKITHKKVPLIDELKYLDGLDIYEDDYDEYDYVSK